jgi:hypothetical protein
MAVSPPDNTVQTVSSAHSVSRLSAGCVRLVARRGWQQARWVETHWYQCLLYPLRAWPLVLILAIVLAGLSGGIALAASDPLAELRAQPSWLLLPYLPFFLIPLLVVGYGTGFLDGTLTSAMAGEVGHIRWPGRNVGLALQSGSRWLICFLAGPVVPAGAALLYWLHGGDLVFLDWIILAELNILAISGWFLLLLAVHQNNRLRDINPVRVAELIHRLGHRLVAVAVLASVIGLAHGWLASVALEKVHHDVAEGWLLLLLCWASGMFFATWLFRWVGVWIYWDRLRHGRDTRNSAAQGCTA